MKLPWYVEFAICFGGAFVMTHWGVGPVMRWLERPHPFLLSGLLGLLGYDLWAGWQRAQAALKESDQEHEQIMAMMQEGERE